MIDAAFPAAAFGASCAEAAETVPAPRHPGKSDLRTSSAKLSASSRTVIYREGEIATRLYEIVEGSVFLIRATPDGQRQILEVIRAGSFLGLPLVRRYQQTAMACTNVRMRPLDRIEIARSPHLQRRVELQLSRHVTQMYQLMHLLGMRSARARLAGYLMQLAADDACERGASRRAVHVDVHLLFTQRDLADLLRLTGETVCRELKWLRQRGYIERPDRNIIRVLDPVALTALAELELPAQPLSVTDAGSGDPLAGVDATETDPLAPICHGLHTGREGGAFIAAAGE